MFGIERPMQQASNGPKPVVEENRHNNGISEHIYTPYPLSVYIRQFDRVLEPDFKLIPVSSSIFMF